MKTKPIDDLLMVVSPSLIEGYERKNDVTLAEVNAEYKTVCDQNTDDCSFGAFT